MLRHIYDDAISRGMQVYATAMTGCAAILMDIRARTLHSWAGIGIGRDPVDVLVSKMNFKARRRWMMARVLMIDEVSMLTPSLMAKLDEIGKRIRKCSLPFGGIQVIMSGDFLQLPPVQREDVPLFKSRVWESTIQETIYLQEIVRQRDVAFQSILNKIRVGEVDDEVERVMATRAADKVAMAQMRIRPLHMFMTNAKVDAMNDARLRKIEDAPKRFEVRTVVTDPRIDMSKINQQDLADIDQHAGYSMILELKRGAQVMLIRNLDTDGHLVNGSQGVVDGFCEQTGWPMVSFSRGTARRIAPETWESDSVRGLGRSQVPLRLCYAATCHKLQGQTVDTLCVDLGSSVFEYGQSYVAISRIRELDNLHLLSFDATKIRADPDAVAYYRNLNLELNCDEEISQAYEL